MAEQNVIENIQKYMQRLEKEGLPVAFTVLYGSHARGDSHKWSDVDLIVVSPRFDDMRAEEDINTLWYLAAMVDNRIEPTPCGLEQWDQDDESAIIEIARREGRKIFVSTPVG